MATAARLMQPGRACPLRYRYTPEDVGAATPFDAETMYVIGGLYGNEEALAAVLERAANEPRPVTLAFNGDFHWFDVDAAGFKRVSTAVLEHVALRGNVETELAAEDDGAGCGCAYPDWVGDAEVERSNEILRRLRDTARAFPALRASLGRLPMHAIAQIAAMRVALVHGDAESLSGWGYSQEALANGDRSALAAHFERARVRVIASSHTCLPVATEVETALGRGVLFNNGAAGMPNFAGTSHGVITRIATTAAQDALYGTRLGPLFIDALPVHYDQPAWLARFAASWPDGSAAHRSYYARIVHGPRYEQSSAARWKHDAAAVT